MPEVPSFLLPRTSGSPPLVPAPWTPIGAWRRRYVVEWDGGCVVLSSPFQRTLRSGRRVLKWECRCVSLMAGFS